MTSRMRPPRTLTCSHALRKLAANRLQLKRLGVEKIALYGSVARDEATPQSDVDVLVELAESFLTLVGYMDLCFYLEELFGRRVDVTTFRSIKPHMRDRVLADAVYLEMREDEPVGSGS
ncbi:MAG: nucleotidyltransferase family protein [Chloroflexi bacterium]|nr:nucleotidyltransferase family protein [Chloroflexota bacterium]